MNPEPTNLNDLAAIARTTKSVHYRRALASASAEIEFLRARVKELEGMPQLGFELTSFKLIAADEIKRLRAERDEVRQSYCSLMEAYRGGDGRVTANKLGWGYLFEEDK